MNNKMREMAEAEGRVNGGVNAGQMPYPTERKCRVCGCTEDNACVKGLHGACYWVEADLCSECKSESGESGA